ncbi:HAMP domain-containing protein [Peptoclostridium litorale DSM 5388]|uniref:histidine kinase n=2 Tax=Peptoclostridium litorale TaxID=1557 RepID=A0A069RH18_PEPLI|nr:signal transduction histidine kinase [Peptoclostridium litorale DSM 5388]SIO18129.1 HAMP domain-containing protein [Peptoclostridium litorale DSM 5388]
MYIRQLNHTKNLNGVEELLQSEGDNVAKQLDKMMGMNVAIYNMAGEEVGDSLLFSSERDTEDILSYALKDNVMYQVIGDTMDYMSPLYDVDGPVGVIRFQYSLKKYVDFYKEVKSLFVSLGIAVIVISFMGAYFYFDRFVQLIFILKRDADRISMGDYDSIVPVKRNDEIGELSRGIYHMNIRIKDSICGMKDEQRKLEKQQKTFIGNITHEFKTPLTVIKAYVDLLDMYGDDPDLLKDANANIGKEADRLYELVDKVLHLSYLEKYDFELQSEKLDIKDVIEEVCRRMGGKAQKFNIQLEEKLMEKVFDSFYTVDKNRSREYGGTGLGLAIVKGLVEKQGGSIDIAHNKPNGTTFTVYFPLY